MAGIMALTSSLPPNISEEIRRGANLKGLFEMQRAGDPLHDPRVVQHLRALHLHAQVAQDQDSDDSVTETEGERLKKGIFIYNKKNQMGFQITLCSEVSNIETCQRCNRILYLLQYNLSQSFVN
jgi:hypothetical protein